MLDAIVTAEPAIFARAVTSAALQIPMEPERARVRGLAVKELLRSLEDIYHERGLVQTEAEILTA